MLSSPASPRASARRITRLVVHQAHAPAAEESVRAYVATYVDVCEEVGLDSLLVVSQLVVETSKLREAGTSPYLDWLRPPAISQGTTTPSTQWGDASRAHAGLVLAFAVAPGDETPAQRALMEHGFAKRHVPDNLRGSAPTLDRLVGTWTHRPDYADVLRRFANQILEPQY
jgi:hypothetical protein